MTREQYLRDLDAAEAGIELAKATTIGAQVRIRHYNVLLDGIAALRNNIRLGARPWER